MDFLRRDVERGAQRGAVLFNKPLMLGSMPKTNLPKRPQFTGFTGLLPLLLTLPPNNPLQA